MSTENSSSCGGIFAAGEASSAEISSRNAAGRAAECLAACERWRLLTPFFGLSENILKAFEDVVVIFTTTKPRAPIHFAELVIHDNHIT